MKRLPARHPDWIGHLVLSSVDDSIQHEEFGRSGRYKETGDELHVFWNDHVPEIFHLDVTENIYVWLCWIDKEPKDQENLYIDKKNEETEYLFITTHEYGNALLRVQSKPLYNGLLYLKKMHHISMFQIMNLIKLPILKILLYIMMIIMQLISQLILKRNTNQKYIVTLLIFLA